MGSVFTYNEKKTTYGGSLKEKPHNNGQWTAARFKGFVTSALRAASSKWPPKYQTLNEAKTEKRINPKSGKMAQHYRCNVCKKEFTSKDIQINHKDPVVPISGFTSWDDYISRLFCEKEKLEAVCIGCHKCITREENEMRKGFITQQESATYQCWLDMKGRCYNPNNQRYYTHGARGISVCSDWRESYDLFVKDMGLKPEGYTIDRIDNDGNYQPSNCKWSSPKEQANNRRTNIYVTYNDETFTVKQWSEIMGISFSAMMKRLSNWPIEKALSPVIYEVPDVPEQIKEEILSKYGTGEYSQLALAKEYGISQAAISKWVVAKTKKKEHNAD